MTPGEKRSDPDLDEIRAAWNGLADDWRIQVGDEGDGNRLLNSDPVLWKFAGDVQGLTVLDAGCGTGYLSKKLHDRGAIVTGIDLSERKSEFIWFHRPLSDYWKAFKAAGFDVDDFEEPRVTPERYHLAKTERGLQSSKTRPYSVAFRLVKRSPAP